jgi:hypothetical protein
VVDQNVPYLLQVGKFWLKADGLRIVANSNQKEASHFYVIPNSKSEDSFYIAYRTEDNKIFYVFADSKDDVKLQRSQIQDKYLLEVYWVHDKQLAKMSDWSNRSLFIRPKHLGYR